MQKLNSTKLPITENAGASQSREPDNVQRGAEPMPLQQRTVGRTNPSLLTLKKAFEERRNRTGSLPAKVVEELEELEKYHGDPNRPRTNLLLLASNSPADTQKLSYQGDDWNAMHRSVSYLPIKKPLGLLRGVMKEVIESDASVSGRDAPSEAVLAVNSIVTAVKSQIEHLNNVALEKARDGNRICPMTLNPVKFNDFLACNTPVLDNLVKDCFTAAGVRDRAALPHLITLARSYFDLSTGYPGAPQSQPHAVEVMMGAEQQSQVTKTLFGKKTVHLSIDSKGLNEFCAKPLPPLEECTNFKDVFRAHLMTGFEHHPRHKKLAAMYVQLMLHEVSEVQELMGAKSAIKSAHSEDAQRAGRNTLNEMYYKGSENLGDQTQTHGRLTSQRAIDAEMMTLLPIINRSYQEKHGVPLIIDEELQQWVHSASFNLDLRTLLEPSARLLLQRAPINAQSLLRLPAFSPSNH